MIETLENEYFCCLLNLNEKKMLKLTKKKINSFISSVLHIALGKRVRKEKLTVDLTIISIVISC